MQQPCFIPATTVNSEVTKFPILPFSDEIFTRLFLKFIVNGQQRARNIPRIFWDSLLFVNKEVILL